MTAIPPVSDESILRKYLDGRDLDPEDESHVMVLCSVGMMKTGLNLKRKVVTAKTIALGLKLIECSRVDPP